MQKNPDTQNLISLDQHRSTVRDTLAFIREVRGELEEISRGLNLIDEDTQPHNICHASLTGAAHLTELAERLRARVNQFAVQHGEVVHPSRNRVTATRVTPEEAAAIAEQERSEAASSRELAVQARLLFDRGRGDRDKAMSLLARAFPSLSRADGVEPFDALALAQWAKGGKSHGEICAARFILSVWNSAELRNGEFGLAFFDLDEALGVWDRYHQQALAGWIDEPWWP